MEERSLDARPPVTAVTIVFRKMITSYFMPNRVLQWIEISNVGNPTKSAEFNDFVKSFIKKEARKEGAEQKKWSLPNSEEYCSIIHILNSSKDTVEKYGIPTLMIYQFHPIARIGDTTQVTKRWLLWFISKNKIKLVKKCDQWIWCTMASHCWLPRHRFLCPYFNFPVAWGFCLNIR